MQTLKVIGFKEEGEIVKVVYGEFDASGTQKTEGVWEAPAGTTTDEALLEFAKGKIAPGQETEVQAVVEINQEKADEFLAEQARVAGQDGTQPIPSVTGEGDIAAAPGDVQA